MYTLIHKSDAADLCRGVLLCASALPATEYRRGFLQAVVVLAVALGLGRDEALSRLLVDLCGHSSENSCEIGQIGA